MTGEVRGGRRGCSAVTHVHFSGKVDVKYDIDGSAGIFLTAKALGLKLLGGGGKEGGRREEEEEGCA